MTHKNTTLFLLGLACLSQVFADENPCSSQHNLNRVSIRHIESKGLGYNQGYTTLEGFFVPLSALNTRWVPFLDLRGHIFNNSKPAANAGIGLRYIDSRVWGGNLYYDYRKTSKQNYNQISFGLESLGRYLDYRVNGYFPVGKHTSALGTPSFDSFSGNSLYIARKQELALKGGNGEVGIHIAKVKGIDFYSALGPYYFGNSSKHTFGGEFRLGMDVLNILRIEGNTSYDHLFKWIGQGQISLSYAFTPKTISRKQKKGSCSFQGFVRERAFQRVDKQEIVVVTTQKKKSVAINPLTGLPYVVWFVDNTSHSAGTYESPFNTLLDAQNASHTNDIIAILPGDGTDTGMNVGITLKDGQKIWGMSVVHALPTTVGTIRIRPLAQQMPIVSNSNANVHVIRAGHSNDIIGLKTVEAQGNYSIYITNGGNHNIENNIISSIQSGRGVVFESAVANAQVVNNTFLGDGVSNLWGIGVVGCSGNFTIANNLFTGTDEHSGFKVGVIAFENSLIECSILNNKIRVNKEGPSRSSNGIVIQDVGSSINVKFLVADNTVDVISADLSQLSNAGIFTLVASPFSGTLRNNQVTTFDAIAVPPYKFLNLGGASVSQINFAPDNVGKPVYQSFL